MEIKIEESLQKQIESVYSDICSCLSPIGSPQTTKEETLRDALQLFGVLLSRLEPEHEIPF